MGTDPGRETSVEALTFWSSCAGQKHFFVTGIALSLEYHKSGLRPKFKQIQGSVEPFPTFLNPAGLEQPIIHLRDLPMSGLVYV